MLIKMSLGAQKVGIAAYVIGEDCVGKVDLLSYEKEIAFLETRREDCVHTSGALQGETNILVWQEYEVSL